MTSDTARRPYSPAAAMARTTPGPMTPGWKVSPTQGAATVAGLPVEDAGPVGAGFPRLAVETVGVPHLGVGVGPGPGQCVGSGEDPEHQRRGPQDAGVDGGQDGPGGDDLGE